MRTDEVTGAVSVKELHNTGRGSWDLVEHQTVIVQISHISLKGPENLNIVKHGVKETKDLLNHAYH